MFAAAFDCGITHFMAQLRTASGQRGEPSGNLARGPATLWTNYVSSKAGWIVARALGNGDRKYLVASLDQTLAYGLDYVTSSITPRDPGRQSRKHGALDFHCARGPPCTQAFLLWPEDTRKAAQFCARWHALLITTPSTACSTAALRRPIEHWKPRVWLHRLFAPGARPADRPILAGANGRAPRRMGF